MARLRGQHRVQQQHRLQIEESNIRPSGGEFWGAIDDKVSDWEAKRRNQRADEAERRRADDDSSDGEETILFSPTAGHSAGSVVGLLQVQRKKQLQDCNYIVPEVEHGDIRP